VLFFLACNLSQAQSIFSRDSSKINSAAFYIVYNNWNDTLGSTNLIGVGGRIEIQDRPIFQEFEILLPIGRKTMEVVSVINLDAGVNIFGGNALFSNDLKTSINAGIGVKGILKEVTKSLSNDLNLRLHFFVGVDWNFRGYNINLKYGYVFLNNPYKINYWNINLGYLINYSKFIKN